MKIYELIPSVVGLFFILVVAGISPPDYQGLTGEVNPLAIPVSIIALIIAFVWTPEEEESF